MSVGLVNDFRRNVNRATLARQTREWCMPPRRDWNAVGVPVPAWFRRRLKLIDPGLVLQYIPPKGILGSDLDPQRYPFGAWVICHRLRRTGWLHKRWVWSLVDEHGNPREPTLDLLELLRTARDLWRRGRTGRLEQEYDRSMAAIARAKTQESRDRLIEGNIATMRRLNIRSHPNRPMVAVPS